MTSLVAWVGVDSRRPSSIYFASDSRISWPDGYAWDYGRKLFASRTQPDILGYSGDVAFPSHTLGQIVDLIDAGLLIADEDAPTVRLERILSVIRNAFETYPPFQKRPFSIVYGTREYAHMKSNFSVACISWAPDRQWIVDWMELPRESGIIRVFGSGERAVEKWYSRWHRTSESRTSRSVFSAFCDALGSGDDALSGGAPQLVRLYRIGRGQDIGVIWKEKCFTCGLPVTESANLERLEWRNRVFERCDWRTKGALQEAQRHRRPSGLGRIGEN